MNDGFDEKLPFVMDFTNAIYSGRPPLEIAIDAVRRIAVTHLPPYNLMVSGGVDSQAMVWAWLQSGVPFNAISFQYVDDHGEVVNNNDLEMMSVFAEKHNIIIKYQQIKIHEFLNTNLEDYVISYQCTSPQICTHMHMADIVNEGTIIYSGNFLYPHFIPLNYTIYGLARFAQRTSLNVIPFFFMHDPELAPAFMNRIEHSIDDNAAYVEKCRVYQSSGFPVIPQEIKMTGFEAIKEYYDQFPKKVAVATRLRYASQPSKRVFDLLYRYRWRSQVKYIDPITVINLHHPSN